MKEYKNYYFKDRPEGIMLMSGMPLPKAEDGKVHNVHFIDCEMHPNCDPARYPDLYVDCKFTGCN